MSEHEHEKIEVTQGSGNVFADLGFENAEELQAKAVVTFRIYKILRGGGLTLYDLQELGISIEEGKKLFNSRHTELTLEELNTLFETLEANHDLTI